MLRRCFCSLLITIFVTLPFLHLYTKFFYFPEPLPEPQTILSKETRVVSRVGGYILDSLTGWTSPFAEVTLTSQGLARKTTADETGFFAYYFIPVPENLGEICLIAQDTNQLPSFPTCLAPPPKNQNIKIINVLLPPTISLESAQIIAGRTAKSSGMTFPDSTVLVYFFSDNNYEFKFFSLFTSRLLPRPAYALGLPKYTIKSNQNGYFEFSLPASNPSTNRVYAASLFGSSVDTEEKRSPKSNILAFESVGLWGMLKLFLRELFRTAKAFFGTFPQNPLNVIFLEIIIFLTLIAIILFRKYRQRYAD